MNEESESPSDKLHPLAGVAGLPEPVITTLKTKWIATAEEVLALAASAQGRAGLQRLLSYDDAQLETLLSDLARAVGPENAARLSAGARGGELGLALTPEQKRRFGIQPEQSPKNDS